MGAYTTPLKAICLWLPFVAASCGDGRANAHDAGTDGDTDSDTDSDSDSDTDSDPVQFPPMREATLPLDGQLLFPVELNQDGATRHMVVDTGAVRTALEETLLDDVSNGVGTATVDFGDEVVLTDFEMIAADLSAAVDHIGVEIAGLIGQDLFTEYFFALDYRTPAVAIAKEAPSQPPPGFAVSDAIDVPYSFEQGMPIIDVAIGDSAARLIADTGSGVTILTESAVDPALLDDGVSGYVWYTSYGSDPGTIVRLPHIEIGGIDVADSWAVVVPDDHHLAEIFDLMGVDVDGFAGFPIYRRFFISVFGAQSRYELFAYPQLDHVPADEWDRIGVEVMRDADELVIDMVFSPSDAVDAGLAPGDVISAIDGQPTADMALDDARLLLRGSPGETRALTLGSGATAMEVEVAVDRLLEPFAP